MKVAFRADQQQCSWQWPSMPAVIHVAAPATDVWTAQTEINKRNDIITTTVGKRNLTTAGNSVA